MIYICITGKNMFIIISHKLMTNVTFLIHFKKIMLFLMNVEQLQLVGTVGSGKSSLVSAMLGELEKRSGRVNVIGKKQALNKYYLELQDQLLP